MEAPRSRRSRAARRGNVLLCCALAVASSVLSPVAAASSSYEHGADDVQQFFGPRLQHQEQQEPVYSGDGWKGEEEDAAVPNPLNERFEELVEETMAHWHVPGMSVAVVQGLDTFAKGYGIAVYPDTNATEDTLYYVGSTSKSFTAASILLLIEDSAQNGSGLPSLKLTTPVSSLIRDEFVLPDAYATEHSTLEDLLTHRTGMPRHDLSYRSSFTLRENVENLRHLPLTRALRTEFQYCNMMFSTLAYVVEALTSSAFGEFVRARVWRPLSMAHTYYSLADARAAPGGNASLSRGYFWDNATGVFVPEPYLGQEVLQGAGAIISSAADYAKYLKSMLTHRPNFFPDPRPYGELRVPRILSDPDALTGYENDDARKSPWASPETYTLGWMLQTYRGGGSGGAGAVQVYSHSGSVTGFAALMAYAPAIEWGAVVFANTEIRGNWAAARLLHALLDERLGVPDAQRYDWVAHFDNEERDVLERLGRAREILYPDAPKKGADAVVPPALGLEKYAGTYSNEGYGALEFVLGRDGEMVLPTRFLRQRRGSEGAWGGGAAQEGWHLHADVLDRVWQHSLCLEHVSGEYFLAWYDYAPGNPNAIIEAELPMKAVFRVGVDGEVEELALGYEPRMGEELIVFKRVKS